MCKLKLGVVGLNSKNVFFIIVIVLFNVLQLAWTQNDSDIEASDKTPVPDDVFVLGQLAVKQMKQAWTLTDLDNSTDVAEAMNKFWKKLKAILTVIHDPLKLYDRRISNNRPSSFMNRVLELQDLENLKKLSDTNTTNPFVKWRVKWIELSSLATHIHRLYNKRLRDIFNNDPYIKTIAQSVVRYQGYPWYSKLSGNVDDRHRFLMNEYPQWIEDRFVSVPEGDLFFGLRKLIDENPTSKTSSTVESGDCKGSQTIGRIVPSTLESPIYVLLYLALVDIKYYILKTFYHIHSEVYEFLTYNQFGTLEKELNERLKHKVDMYNKAFKDFGKTVDTKGNLPTPVEPGYFRCDPPQIAPDNPVRNHTYESSYIKLTNFLKVFISPEKSFRRSGACRGSCDMIDGTKTPCNKTDTACIAEFENECVKNPAACEGFKPPCPIEDTVCFDSGREATFCPSKRPDRVLEWATMNGKILGGDGSTCTETIMNETGKWKIENEAIADTPNLCEVCLCHCYSPIKKYLASEDSDDMMSVRSFSLKPALSSTTENKIVVGIKFEQVQDQIHLMIAEAKALPNYQVDMSTLLWRKPRVAIETSNPPQLIKLRRNLRIIHLDDIVAPKDYVVTGARFVVSSYQGAFVHEYIGIQLQVSKITEAGQLVPKSGQWIGNNNSSISRESYSYVEPDDPINADGPALPDSSSNHFIPFRSTSISKDLGQSTIPYFDAQRVILDAEKTSWLRGIGIYHKIRPRFGGFIGLKIMKYGDKLLA